MMRVAELALVVFAAAVSVGDVRAAAQAIDPNTISRPAGLSEGVMLRLDRATWIEAGDRSAENIVYVFVDMECPYCRTLYSRIAAANPRVRVRYLPVAVLKPSSWGKAASVLQAPDARAALDGHERGLRALSATSAIRPQTRTSLEQNNLFMEALMLQGTPGIVYRDAAGAIHAFAGVPDEPSFALMFHTAER